MGGAPEPPWVGEASSVTLIFVDDVDATIDRVAAVGGSIVQEPTDQPWGLRQAVVADPEGQRWKISQHLRGAPPREWGAEQLGPMPGRPSGAIGQLSCLADDGNAVSFFT
jgi:hypothetical protein